MWRMTTTSSRCPRPVRSSRKHEGSSQEGAHFPAGFVWMTPVTGQGGGECGKRTRMLRTVPALVLGLLLGVVMASACGPSRTCSSVTCTGCCDTTGECRSGFDNSACGTKGGSCNVCGLGSTCLSGACSLNNSGAGTAGTGGGFSGTGGGVVTAGGRAGGTGGGAVTVCNSTNCPGCCDATGQCFAGQADVACGTMGATCLACPSAQRCTPLAVGGRCLGNPTGGGSAGGGSAVGGGSPGCNSTNCAGCCRSNGQCQTAPTSAQCGVNGAACAVCPATQSCQAGTCLPCAGCIDISTGTCMAGTSNSACGSSGGFCSACSGPTPFCSGQRCTAAPPPMCSASNCAGCCDPMSGQCIPRSAQSTSQCGQGTNGATCISCAPGSCDTVAGQCTGTGFDGGLPPLPDGGFSTCAIGAQCAAGECCYAVFGIGGVCARIGNANLLGGTTCGVSQSTCGSSCVTGQTCQSGACF